MSFNQFFVKNYQFTLVLFIAVLILGANSLMNMPRSEDPPFGAPIFSIVAIYPGTTPKDMEQLIVDPIEEELYQLSDIKKINTSISDGLMVMLVDFNYGVDVEAKNNDIVLATGPKKLGTITLEGGRLTIALDPESGSVIAVAPMTRPSARPGSHSRFCASLPKAHSGPSHDAACAATENTRPLSRAP